MTDFDGRQPDSDAIACCGGVLLLIAGSLLIGVFLGDLPGLELGLGLAGVSLGVVGIAMQFIARG